MSFRRFRQNLPQALVAALLGIAIGATVCVAFVFDGFVLRPFIAEAAERVVAIDGLASDVADGDHVDWWGKVSGLEHFAIFYSGDLLGGGADRSGWVRVSHVSSAFFSVFGQDIAPGRQFARTDEFGSNLAIVSRRYLTSHFGGRLQPDSHLILEGNRYDVIGVAPARFEFPNQTQVWIVRSRLSSRGRVDLVRDLPGRPPVSLSSGAIGLLRPGITPTAVQVEFMRLLAEANAARTAETGIRYGDVIDVTPLAAKLSGSVRQILLLVALATTLLLLLGVGHSGVFLIDDAIARRDETATKLALGATYTHLGAEVTRRALLIGVVCGATSAWATGVALPFLRAILISFDLNLEGSATLVAAAGGVGLIVGVAHGIVTGAIAVSVSHRSLVQVVRGATLASGSDNRSRRVALVFAVTLAVVMTAGAIDTARVSWELSRVQLGYKADGLLRTIVGQRGQERAPARVVDTGALLRKVGAVPGVVVAAISSTMAVQSIERDYRSAAFGERSMMVAVSYVTPRYFETLGLRRSDRAGQQAADHQRSAVVNRTLWRLMGEGHLVGRPIRVNGVSYQITAVVEDVRGANEPANVPEVFLPFGTSIESANGEVVVIARCRDSCAKETLAGISQAVESDGLTVYAQGTVAEDVWRVSAPQRASSGIWGMYACLSIGVTMLGLATMVRSAATRRRMEIATRTALGAPRRAIVGLLVREALECAVIGVALGIFAYGTGTSLAQHYSPLPIEADRCTMVLVAFGYCAIVGLASFGPAWRLCQQDPRMLFADAAG